MFKTQCDKCKYWEDHEGCMFYCEGSGNSKDMPCYGGEEEDDESNT